MTSEELSAQVVLRPGRSDLADDDIRAAEASPPAEVADHAMGWFRAQGFGTADFVGISFAISGPSELFEQVFGARPAAGEYREMSLAGLAADVRDEVQAVVVGPPPDFGPGNP